MALSRKQLKALKFDPNVDISGFHPVNVTGQHEGEGVQIIGGFGPKSQTEPPDWKFLLEFQRGEKIYDPTEAQIASGLRSLRVVEGDSYCILSRRDYNYVQVMCGANGFHVEWRVFYDGDWNKFDHFKAGYPSQSNRKEHCQKAVYRVTGFDNELLKCSEAIEIFLAFSRSEAKPARFAWRRMTDEELS